MLQFHLEDRAPVGVTFHGDLSIHEIGQALGDAKAKAGAFNIRHIAPTEKRLKYASKKILRHADPSVADSKKVTAVSYTHLVHIYEYTPGFLHSKVVSADEASAVVGSCNFDFRSLYLHFERCV